MHGSCISHFSLPFSPGQLFAHFAVNCTWEGDNTVMALQVGRAFGGLQRRGRRNLPPPHWQTARYLVASVAKARAGQPLAGSVTYLEASRRFPFPSSSVMLQYLGSSSPPIAGQIHAARLPRDDSRGAPRAQRPGEQAGGAMGRRREGAFTLRPTLFSPLPSPDRCDAMAGLHVGARV